ncbi:MAG TPA: NAD+ synthase [Ferrovibrio sp.]|uniref:NAD+ synthase n=1 Tax=Ferrovibrio sp. TaxID=1917215 RepID=UPI002B4B3EFE|nr:NAD+ synthase [Ferrovibrio sp.]HLT78430.1 NAD+ synthase [Ferrovibrio sp.]
MSAAPDRLTIALAQINSVMGDIPGNRRRVEEARARAAAAGADLVVYPELVIVGYPPEDLVLRLSLQEACEAAVRELAAQTADGGPAMLVTSPWRDGGKLYNSALLLEGGQIAAVRHKHELPNYGVFDEKRTFAPGPLPGPVPFRGVRLGVMICEDMWAPDVAECLSETGAEILVVPNGSPFETDKWDTRLNLAVARVVESGLPLIYVNRVGGQDELVFDGGGFVLNADRSMVVRQPEFREDLTITTWHRQGEVWSCDKGPMAEAYDDLTAIYQAMMVGLRDYVQRNRFPGVVLGLSGGIDSALSAAVAVDALGADKVRCIMLPSKYTSSLSLTDAEACAKALGVSYETIPISPAVEAFDAMLRPAFQGREPDITEENLQARVRGVVLMAISNKFGHMVLTTGNKSEMSVGYATLYGDMCGGYSVLKDVYKMTVFALSRWRNANVPEGGLGPKGIVIPESIIVRPPSAELRENQTDQDSLPPYEQLDAILQMLVEKEMPVRDIVASGQPEDVVRRIQHLLYLAEYKRRQAPPGVRVSNRAFGRDWRYPITSAY